MSTKPISLNISKEDFVWPEIIEFDSNELPSLRGIKLPSWAGDIGDEISESLEVPYELSFTSVLVSISVAVARRYKVQIYDSHIEPCNLWVMTALDSGSRKSSVMNKAKSPLSQWQKNKQAEAREANKAIESERRVDQVRLQKLMKTAATKSGEDYDKLKKQIVSIEEGMKDLIDVPQLYTDDCTPETLTTVLKGNDECLAWMSTEGNLFDILGGQYSSGNANIDIFLKGHAGEDVNVNRGSRPNVFLREPKLTIGLCPQPKLLEGAILKNKKLLDSGLLNRFLFFIPPSNIGKRSLEYKPLCKKVQFVYEARMKELLNVNQCLDGDGNQIFYILELSPEARAMHKQFAIELESKMAADGELANLRGWASKAPDAAARIAAVIHCVSHFPPEKHLVKKESMETAISIVKVSTKHTQKIFQIMGGDIDINRAKELRDWLQQQRKGTIKLRDIQQSLKQRVSFQKVKAIKDALELLEERGYVKLIDIGDSYRPSYLVEMNPSFIS